jgi:hypothetical protein
LVLYPFNQIDEVPVFGSSSFGRMDEEGVHWRPVLKDPSFDPLARAQLWPPHRLTRFAWLAGAEQRKLGYLVHRRRVRGSSRRDPNRFAPPEGAAGIQ